MERIQKIIANSGYCSRRKAEDLIKAGRVTVTGEIVQELGRKASYGDPIMIAGKALKKEENAVWVTIDTPPEILKYIIEKGSIAIDGVSLTVAYVDDSCFKVSIIPHTAKETILLSKQPGDIVNLENDMVGKYVEKLLFFDRQTESKASGGLTMEMLREFDI